jgi:hypothetical protein
MIVLYFVGEFPQHMTRCPSSHGIPGIREARLATSPQVRHGIGLHQDLTVKSEVYQMGPIRRYHRWDNIQYISYHIKIYVYQIYIYDYVYIYMMIYVYILRDISWEIFGNIWNIYNNMQLWLNRLPCLYDLDIASTDAFC